MLSALMPSLNRAVKRGHKWIYWHASQSGSSSEQALGTSAASPIVGSAVALAAAAGAELIALETEFKAPVSMVDFSVVVAAKARR